MKKLNYITLSKPVEEKDDGARMIKVNLRLWTKGSRNETHVAKQAYSAGTVKVESNDFHGIENQGDPLPFHSIEGDLLDTIIEALNRAGIKFY